MQGQVLRFLNEDDARIFQSMIDREKQRIMRGASTEQEPEEQTSKSYLVYIPPEGIDASLVTAGTGTYDVPAVLDCSVYRPRDLGNGDFDLEYAGFEVTVANPYPMAMVGETFVPVVKDPHENLWYPTQSSPCCDETVLVGCCPNPIPVRLNASLTVTGEVTAGYVDAAISVAFEINYQADVAGPGVNGWIYLGDPVIVQELPDEAFPPFRSQDYRFTYFRMYCLGGLFWVVDWIFGLYVDGTLHIQYNRGDIVPIASTTDCFPFDLSVTDGTAGTSGAEYDVVRVQGEGIKWEDVMGTPTTIAGYGITDAISTADIGVTIQAYDAELTAIAGLTSAADKGIYFTGSGTAGTYDLTAAARSILDDATVGDIRTTLGVGTGNSPEFAAVNLGNASDTTLTRSSAGVLAVEGVTVSLNSTTSTHTTQQIELGHATDTTITRVSAGVIAVEGSNVLLASGIGSIVQGYDTELAAIAGLTSASNKIPRFTGSGTADLLDFDTDGTLASNSDTRLPSQKAVKTYVDTAVTGLLDFKGSTDASANPNYPAASKGDAYVISVAGRIGGASGKQVDIGDVYLATADNAGGTEASVGTSWTVLEHNLVGAYFVGGTDVSVPDGGSGRSDATAYAVICGGTTSTGAHQSIVSVGTANQVLTSNGAGALPTFQAAQLGSLNLTGADPELADKVGGYDVSGSANASFLVSYLLALHPPLPGGRLGTDTGAPYYNTTSEQTSLLYIPAVSDKICLWDGTRWVVLTFSETSLALGTMTGGLPYDIFGYSNSGTFTMEKLAWSSANARATGISTQDGRFCKTGDKTRLYLGTIMPHTSTQVKVDSSWLGIWNMYDRTPHTLFCIEATDSWTYTTDSWRQSRNSVANQVDFVIGIAGDSLDAFAHSHSSNSAAAIHVGVGIGINSKTSNAAIIRGDASSAAGASKTSTAVWSGIGLAGANYLAWLERSTTTSGTTTWYGDAGGISTLQTGMVVRIFA